MCTALKYKHLMGRNYDYEQSFKEEVVRIPSTSEDTIIYDIVGIGTGYIQDYPLLYDGMNECGLCVAGLSFTNAHYTYHDGQINIPSYDFTYQILRRFDSVHNLMRELDTVNITDEPYSKQVQSTKLHWLICDKDDSIIVEQTNDGFNIYKGDVLTNNPPYPKMLDYYDFSSSMVGDTDMNYIKDPLWYSRGRETDGLAGGYSSDERFERVKYLKTLNENHDKFDPVMETSHLLNSVEQIYGLTPVNDSYEYTIYKAIYDMEHRCLYTKPYSRDYWEIHQMPDTYDYYNDEPLTEMVRETL